MAKGQPQYLQEINERTELYRQGLTQVQYLKQRGQYKDAIEHGFKTILTCGGIVLETNDLPQLFERCSSVMEALPQFISMSLPLPEIAKRLEGILIERHAFYTQLKNSSN